MTVDRVKAPQKGQFVQSLRGRDRGEFAIIIAIEDERFVYIADGDKRKFDRPKKKSIRHLILEDEVSDEVVDSLSQVGRVSNGKLRYALNQFIEKKLTHAIEKGD